MKESHGPAIGVVIDTPGGFKVDYDLISREMARRRPRAKCHRYPKKPMREIGSGVFEDHHRHAIHLMIRNEDAPCSKDYSHLADTFRTFMQIFTYHANTDIEIIGVVQIFGQRRQPG